MSNSLVPIISSEQLDAVARDFLERYYQEALYKLNSILNETLIFRHYGNGISISDWLYG